MRLAKSGLPPEKILETEELPGRNYQSILNKLRRLKLGSFDNRKKFSFDNHKRPPKSPGEYEIMSLKRVVELWSRAFQECVDMEDVQDEKLRLERLRILFMAGSKYAKLLAAYERMSEVEERLERLEAMVEEIYRKG